MSKKVTVSFERDSALTVKEITANLRAVYGNNAEIEVSPGNRTPVSYLHYAISELLTEEQALIFFDQPEQYEIKLRALRHKIEKELLYVLNDVIMENEESFSS